MRDSANGEESRGIDDGFGEGNWKGSVGGAGGALEVVWGAGRGQRRKRAGYQGGSEDRGGLVEDVGVRWVGCEDGDATGEGVEEREVEVGRYELREGGQSRGFAVMEGGGYGFVVLRHGCGFVEGDGAGFGVNIKGLGLYGIDNRFGRLKVRRVQCLE